MASELLPCPFCGGSGDLRRYLRDKKTNLRDHWVTCVKCFATPKHSTTEAAAISVWNTRAAHSFEEGVKVAREIDRMREPEQPAEPQPVSAGEQPNVPHGAACEETQLKLERVKSRLAGMEDAISAFSDEALIADNEKLHEAIEDFWKKQCGEHACACDEWPECNHTMLAAELRKAAMFAEGVPLRQSEERMELRQSIGDLLVQVLKGNREPYGSVIEDILRLAGKERAI